MALKPVGINDDGSFDGRARDWLNATIDERADSAASTAANAAAVDARADTAAVVKALSGSTQVREQVAGVTVGRPSPMVEFLLDYSRIAGGSGATLTKLTPTKSGDNPLFVLDDDTWDEDASYTSTHYDEATGRLHLTYYAVSTVMHNFSCYAYTDNPEAAEPTFVKPNLGMVTYEGSTDNNISAEGIHAATRWDELSGKWYLLQEPGAVILSSDSPAGPWTIEHSIPKSGFWEAKDLVRMLDGRWVVYYSHRHGEERRSIGVLMSDTPDLHGTWTDHGTKLEPVNQQDQFYAIGVERYGDAFLGMVLRFNSDTDLMWMDLWFSRNGLTWQQAKANWIPLGADSEWDDGMIITGTRLSRLPSEWQVWYAGSPLDHATPAPRGMNIGKAALAPGRLVEATASGTPATMETAPFTPLPGESLYVNADGTGDDVTVEVLDMADNVLSTTTISEDTYAARVDLTAGTQVWVRFTIAVGGKLYGYVLGREPLTHGHVQVSDTFTRASGDWLGYAETGQRWLQREGPWRVTWAEGDIRQAAAATSTSLPATALIDVGTTDYTVSADITKGSGQSPALIVRGTDARNGLCVLPEGNGNRVQIYKRYAGKGVLWKSSATLGSAWANGTTRNLKVTISRNVITVYLDDVEVIQQTMTEAEAALFSSTLAGFFVNDTGSRFDNFLVTT